jgi:hypothetical protein
MRMTVMGVLIVLGGIVMLALVLEYAHQRLNVTKQNETKANSDDQPDLT